MNRPPDQVAAFKARLKVGLAYCNVKTDAEVDRNIKRGFLADWRDSQQSIPKPPPKPPSAPSNDTINNLTARVNHLTDKVMELRSQKKSTGESAF